jgi:hypothetical protein
MTWTMQSLQRMMCGLRGHDAVLHFERHRLSLRCLSCGHETAGWMLQSETRHTELLADSSRSDSSGFGRWRRIVEALASPMNRSDGGSAMLPGRTL